MRRDSGFCVWKVLETRPQQQIGSTIRQALRGRGWEAALEPLASSQRPKAPPSPLPPPPLNTAHCPEFRGSPRTAEPQLQVENANSPPSLTAAIPIPQLALRHWPGNQTEPLGRDSSQDSDKSPRRKRGRSGTGTTLPWGRGAAWLLEFSKRQAWICSPVARSPE